MRGETTPPPGGGGAAPRSRGRRVRGGNSPGAGSEIALAGMVRTELLAAARAARRAPLIPVLVMLLAATGLGVALALWSMLDALYLRSLPLVSADRIVTIIERHPERGRMAVTPANFLDWSQSVHA